MREADLPIAWEAPKGCPSAGDVRSRIAKLLESSLVVTDAVPDLVFRGVVTPQGAGWSLRAETGRASAPNAKNIDAERCELLADAFALIVAFSVDPNLVVPPLVGSSSGPAAPPPLGETERDTNRGFDLLLGPVAAAGVGHMPSLSVGIGGALALETRGGVRFDLGGLVWLPREARFADTPSAVAIRVSMAAFGPSVCLPLAQAGRMHFAACARVEVGQMAGEGIALTPDRGASWWVTVGGGLAAALQLTDTFRLRVLADVAAPLFVPRFKLEEATTSGGDVTYQPSLVFGVLRLQPEVRVFSTVSSSVGHVP